MSGDVLNWLGALLGLPLAAVGVGGLVLAWRNRRTKPTAARMFALGVVLLLGNAGVELVIYTLFPLHEWIDSAILDAQVAYLLAGAARQAFVVTAALLITAAVFVTEDPTERPEPGGTVE
ncbi:hypothetical protein [Alienimonas californiensis]|uniref:Uncharacterized protein n=1 Tax=Alienimonas californiensis TaxID=2527989 RepID=A0A517P8T4_9PLAN|nr:hypothetical protein [Alienimonas californiensis]QDT15793.1 hypothetical protein CA12_18870 [Alienimonas californiensis]